jgi:hypothetical protein
MGSFPEKLPDAVVPDAIVIVQRMVLWVGRAGNRGTRKGILSAPAAKNLSIIN